MIELDLLLQYNKDTGVSCDKIKKELEETSGPLLDYLSWLQEKYLLKQYSFSYLKEEE